jgi:hypothetical protein
MTSGEAPALSKKREEGTAPMTCNLMKGFEPGHGFTKEYGDI